MTSEQVDSHKCHIPIKHAAEIYFDWIADGYTDDNKDYVRMATSVNGTLYALVLCEL